jgi:hypothetical protein
MDGPNRRVYYEKQVESKGICRLAPVESDALHCRNWEGEYTGLSRLARCGFGNIL